MWNERPTCDIESYHTTLTKSKEHQLTRLITTFLDQSVLNDFLDKSRHDFLEATVRINGADCVVEDNIVTPVERRCFERKRFRSLDRNACCLRKIHLGAKLGKWKMSITQTMQQDEDV
jgi:hypothetical protein